MLLKIPPFLHLLLSSSFVHLEVEIKNKNCWCIFKMFLLRSVIVRFLKGLEDMSLNFLHKDQEAIQTPVVYVQKMASTLFDRSY